jgi:hypothetical protein
MIVLADTRFRPSGAGWLDQALRTLAHHRDIGAVGEPAESTSAELGPRSGRWSAGRRLSLRWEGARLDGVGLVAPRAVLARTRGVPEAGQDGGEEGNPCEGIWRLGYRLEPSSVVGSGVLR